MNIGSTVGTPYGNGVVIWCTSVMVLVRVMGIVRKFRLDEVTPWR